MSEQKSTGEWRENALCRRLGLPTDIFFRGADVRTDHSNASMQELPGKSRVPRGPA